MESQDGVGTTQEQETQIGENVVADLEARRSEVAADLHTWRSLTKSVGWQRLMAVAQGQVNERGLILRAPLPNMDACLGQEFAKGEITGIELFQQLPEIEIERLESERDSLTKELNNEVEMVSDAASRVERSQREPIDDGDAEHTGNNPFGEY